LLFIQKYKNMDYLKNLIKDYYEEINISRNDSDRNQTSTLPRYAIMVALCRIANMTEIGQQFNKDHTTVIYAKKKHSKNLRNLDYIMYFNTAEALVSDVLIKIDEGVFSSRNKARDFIFALVRENNYLRSKLESKTV